MNSTNFTKMHGLGNDFMVVDATKHSFKPDRATIVKLANRHTGVGFDQLLIIEHGNEADYHCRIFNGDGSEAEQCGNGLRCVALYLNVHHHCANKLSISTKAGVFPVQIDDEDHISVTLPAPKKKAETIELDVTPHKLTLTSLSMGNPHAILQVAQTATVAIKEIGQQISTHTHFECGTNVGFMEIVTRNHINLRTYERGSGETHACGSNACAAAVAGIQMGVLDSPVKVEFSYGSLQIKWSGMDQPIYMTGPARFIYDGAYTSS